MPPWIIINSDIMDSNNGSTTPGSQIRDYLKERLKPPVLVMALMVGLLFEQLNSIKGELLPEGYPELIPADYTKWMVILLGLGLAALVFRPPRGLFYALVALVLLVHVFFYTQRISRLDQDGISNRDDAVELTAQALLRLENPWSNVPELGMRATSGPASILFAVPFVLVFNDINWLAALFWLLLFLFLLWGDLTRRNHTFPLLVLLFVLGFLGFTHTLFWSLEELYFPFLFIALGYICTTRGRLYLTGAFLGAAVMFRLNYAFIVLGYLVWYYLNINNSWKHQLKMIAGMGIAVVLILAPFVLVGGQEFWTENAIVYALNMSGNSEWPSVNIFFRGLNFLTRQIGEGAMRFVKLGLVVALQVFFSFQLRRLRQPFFHLTLAAFLALTIAWFPPHVPKDYQLFIVIPAFMAVAYTSKKDLLNTSI
jgi:hypothetical protein